MKSKAKLNKALGSVAADVLIKLNYWVTFNVKKGRKPSTSISMQELAAQCGFSFFQTRRAVAKLRREGFIRTERRLFPVKDKARNLNSYSLTLTAEELINGSIEQTESGSLGQPSAAGPQTPSGSCGKSENGSYEQTGGGSFLYTKENTIENTVEKGQSPAETANSLPPILEKEGGEDQDMTMKPYPPKAPHSVHDVAGLLAAKKKIHKPDSHAALVQVWKIGMKEHLPNGLVILTQKAQGQLKTFAKHCEGLSAEDVLKVVMADWIAYTKFCQQEAGAYSLPSSPAVWFLTLFSQQAVAFYLHKQSKPAMPEMPINPKPPSAQLIAGQAPAQPVATLGELLAPIDPADALKD